MSLVLTVVALAALPLQAATQTPQTDTTFAVTQGTRLRMSNQGGDIIVRAWDRSQVRVQASHSRRTSVVVSQSGAVVEVRGRSSQGLSNMVDYQITVPAWMPIELGGMYAYIDVEGVRGAVIAETLEGDITIKGPADQVKATTVSGKVSVEGARGRVEVRSTSEHIRVVDVQGDLLVEGLSGNILLSGIRARTVEAETLSGNLIYEGSIVDGGRYSFLTHSGNISLSVAEATNATISAAVGSGRVSATFPLPTSERPGRRRQTIRLGSGSAVVEAETFSGNVQMFRPTELQERLRLAQEREAERQRLKQEARQRAKPDDGSRHEEAHALHIEPRS